MIPLWLASIVSRASLPWVICGALAVLLGVQTLRVAHCHTDAAKAATAHEKDLRVQAEAIAHQAEVMRVDYEVRVRDSQATADQLTKELSDARDHESRLAADLKSGAVRVRRALCETPGVRSPTPASAAGVDERGAPDGADLAAAAVRAGAEADARLKACIAIAKRDRRP